MKITVLAVGKLKERFWVDACSEYLKRLKPYAQVTVQELPDRDPAKSGGLDAALEKEGESILAALPDVRRQGEGAHCHVILLAIDGVERSSEDIAARIDALALEGCSHIVFVIGGSAGVSAAVRERADEELSFGRITLPHNLARVVLLEQIYRSFKISRGEPYHK